MSTERELTVSPREQLREHVFDRLVDTFKREFGGEPLTADMSYLAAYADGVMQLFPDIVEERIQPSFAHTKVYARIATRGATWEVTGAAYLSHVADAVVSALADAGYEVVPKGSEHHVIEFREHGWTLQHPLSCRPDLFACPVNHAAKGRGQHELGRYECRLDNGRLIVGDRIEEQS